MNNLQCPHCGIDGIYWRPECPHCKGTGIVKVEGLNNTQLPAEADAIKYWREKYSAPFPYTFYEWINSEYATKLHQVEQENAHLKRWKMEATELLTPIHAYVHKNMEVSLGQCNVKLVLDRCKQYETARTLLEKVAYRHEGGLLPDRLLYNEIKTFLDGEK